MLSNSCRYGIRAVMYLAKNYKDKSNIGIKEIADNLELPMPYLAKILQQLAKEKMLISTKGPNGGFSLHKKPESITLFEIVKIIDREDIFKNCLIHNETCASVRRRKKPCPVHSDYAVIRNKLIKLFKNKTIAELVKKAGNLGNVSI